MTAKDIFKKLPALAMLVCDVLMVFALYAEFRVFIPKVNGIGAFWVPLLGMILFAAVFVFSVLKGNKKLFRTLSFVLLFFCNVFTYNGVPAQVALVIISLIDLALEHIHISHPVNLAVFVISFLVCAGLASLLSPFIGKIKTPKMVTNIQETWFSLVEDASNPEPSHEPVVDPNDTVEVPLGRIAGNVITNEFFDPSDPTMSMSIMSSYPLDKMMVFACCDYDPERTLFELAPPYMTEGDSADTYFQGSYGINELPKDWILIEDDSIYKEMRFIPYCDFRSTEGFDAFKDLYVYLGGEHPQSYRYYIDPNAYYKTTSPGYSQYVVNNFTNVPADFRYDLTEFLKDHDIELYPEERYEAVSKLCLVFEREYTYSDYPPELPADKDPVLWFLQESKTGYSKHFAAAEVLLLRTMGIPARYTYGYHFELSPGETMVISEGDAYAYCEVFIDGTWQIVTEMKKPAEDHHESEAENQQGQTPSVPLPVPGNDEGEEAQQARDLIWTKLLVPLSLLLLILPIWLLGRKTVKKYRQTVLQRINSSYKALKKYYFVRKDIMACMLKVRYSKEGAEEDDAKLLEREAETARSHFRYRRKYWTLLKFSSYLRRQKTKALLYNLFGRKS